MFVTEDDLWLAPADGGRAWRISADHAPVADPRFSPDGTMIAWTSWRDGSPEAYLAPVDGGGAERVSYSSDPSTRVIGWTPEGQLLMITAAGQPFAHSTWAYLIPVAAGSADSSGGHRLPFGPVGGVAMDARTTVLLTGTRSREPAFWKRYRGGTAGRLWIAGPSPDGGRPWEQPEPIPDPLVTEHEPRFRRLLAGLAGQVYNPMLVGGRVVFGADHEGTGNLYSCAPDGSDLRRHTDHDGYYVRNPSTDGNRVVYQCAGDIWLLADLDAATQAARLEISLGPGAHGRAPRLISAQDHLGSLSCDQTGQASAIEVRGTVHWLTHRDGPARALSEIGGPAARLPRVLGDTGQVVWVTSADEGDALEVAVADGSGGGSRRRLAAGEIGWVASLAAAPDGGTVAVAAHDGRLLLVDVPSGAVTELSRSGNGPVTGMSWAPDSQWLAWSHPDHDPRTKLRLAHLPDGEVTDVTDGRFIDTDPAFTLDGQFLAFLSLRTFDPVYDAHIFDLSFPYGCRPYLVPLAAATPSPFGPLPGGRPIGAPKDKDDSKGKNGGRDLAGGQPPEHAADGEPAQQAEPVVIDLDGLPSRVVQLPVPESKYASLRAVDGGLAWLREPLTGDLGEGGARPDDDHPRPALEYFDIRRSRCVELLDEADWFKPSGDGTRLVVRDQGRLVVIPAARKADPDNAEDQVRVDLCRARYLADPAVLWRAAFEQANRLVRHEFWVPDLADVDWDGALAAYLPLLDRVGTPDEFGDVLIELIGELGTSHSYVNSAGGDQTGHWAGQLGADLEPGPDGWRVRRILPGESSDPKARSPLAAPGTGIGPGDLLVAVDGQPVSRATGPGPLLVGSAGQPVELTVASSPGGPTRRAVVIPLHDERRLRYQDWVSERRRLVHEVGDGRVGYLHVPDTVSQGWSDLHRDLRGEMLRDSLVVDVRANRGGNNSQLVLEKLARRVIGWDLSRGKLAQSYPLEAPRGPVVAVCDEFAGSDGDIITAAIRILRLGPVVGARTWGGVVGIDAWHELVDGTVVTVPKAAIWLEGYGWGVENYGVDPDIEVVPSPDDWAAGADVQLLAAVQLALEALTERAAATPPSVANRASRRRPPLPPRGSAQPGQQPAP